MDDILRVFNLKQYKIKRQQLRKETTLAERLLWKYLWNRQILGIKFRRQYGVGPYILDFYCPERLLAIEIDGESHGTKEAQEYDAVRTEYLEACHIRILRFTNGEIYQNTLGVAEIIAQHCIHESIENIAILG